MSPAKGRPTAPSHLAPTTRAWWDHVVAEFDLDEHHLRLLEMAAVAWDRHEQARAVLARDGLTYTDRFGAPRTRPEVAIERDSRIAFARLVRELALDGAGTPDAPRPPAVGNGSRYGRNR